MAQVWVSEARKLISCHAIEDGERFCFAFESDFSVFLLRLLEQSFRIMYSPELYTAPPGFLREALSASIPGISARWLRESRGF